MQLARVLILAMLLILISCKDDEPSEPTAPSDPDNLETPHSPTPNNNAVDTDINITLSWECENADDYDIYFGENNPPIDLAEYEENNEINLIGLDYSTKYYWKVIAKQSDGTTKTGDVWNFTTKPEPNVGPGYKMKKYSVVTETPSLVNIMFQVTDLNDKGITNMTTQDFIVYEDNQSVSPTESQMNIKKKDQIPYVLKTVLMIDNSASVAANLQDIKNAANALVNNIVNQQLVAIYKFSENPVLVQDFTSNKGALTSAINSINVGYATTDLYGSIIEGVSRWDDVYETDGIDQGFLLLLTDGSDTQGSHTLNEALSARGDKNIYTVGLGSEIDPSALQQIGNAGFFAVTDVSLLADKFTQIQDEIDLFANSFYWLNYLSPKRGDKDHTLKLEIVNNANSGNDSYITGSFNSRDFTSSYLTLISPEGGEVWEAGSTQEITWDSYGATNVQIDLSTDDGSSWSQIDLVSDQPKKYQWTVPTISSEEAKIKITNADDPQVFSQSNRFTINNPPLEPSNPTPANYSIDQELTLRLGWECSDPDGNSIYYDIYFGESNSPPLVDSNYSSNTYDPGQLEYGMTYYWKIVAEDEHGTISESDVWEFTTEEFNSDSLACVNTPNLEYRGVTYNTVQIGEQCWLKENLNVGKMISQDQNMSDSVGVEKYCYDNDSSKCNAYGGLYQWNEAMGYNTIEKSRGICPDGWHVPSLSEFEYLREYVNGEAKKLLEVGETPDATNESGFSALLVGTRYNGAVSGFGERTIFWSSSSVSNSTDVYRAVLLKNDSHFLLNTRFKTEGFSVRCIMD